MLGGFGTELMVMIDFHEIYLALMCLKVYIVFDSSVWNPMSSWHPEANLTRIL